MGIILGLAWLIFSILDVVGFNGFIRVAYLFDQGYSLAGIFAIIESFFLLINAFFTLYNVYKVHITA
jgi:hypothetical protein